MWGQALGESSGRGFSRQAWFLELGEEQILEVPISSSSSHQCSVPETASGDDRPPSPSDRPPWVSWRGSPFIFHLLLSVTRAPAQAISLASVRKRVKEKWFPQGQEWIPNQKMGLWTPGSLFVRISGAPESMHSHLHTHLGRWLNLWLLGRCQPPGHNSVFKRENMYVFQPC